MENDSNALDDIFVDKNEPVDSRLVADILRGKVTIDREGVVQFTEEGEKLSESTRVLLYLVCRKAMVIKGVVDINAEAVGPTEISQKTGIGVSNSKKITNVTFSKLLIKKDGKYSIPNYNLSKIKKAILENG